MIAFPKHLGKNNIRRIEMPLKSRNIHFSSIDLIIYLFLFSRFA